MLLKLAFARHHSTPVCQSKSAHTVVEVSLTFKSV